jgi:hypothetical protein
MYSHRLSYIGIEGTIQMRDEFSLEDKKCLHELSLTHPKDDMTRIEETKGGLLEDSYVWILKHQAFSDWRDGINTHLLWIKGDPGKGKTMLLIGLCQRIGRIKICP